MHHAWNSPVKNAVTRLESRYVKRTSCIVFSATGISHAEAAQIGILGSTVTATAPLCPWYYEQVPSIAIPTLLSIACCRVCWFCVFPITKNKKEMHFFDTPLSRKGHYCLRLLLSWGIKRASKKACKLESRYTRSVQVIPMSTLNHSLASYSHSHAIAPVTKLRCRQQPREITGYPRNVLTVQLDHLDRHLVTVIMIAIDTARAGQTLAVVPPRELLVNAVGQCFTGVYQLQLSVGLTKPNLSQCHVCVSVEKTNIGDKYRRYYILIFG